MSLRLKCSIFAVLSLTFIPSAGADTVANQSLVQQKQVNWQERPDFGKYFQQAGVKGTFLLYDLKKNQYLVYNAKRANTRYVPASTFKIFNSLVALDTGVVKDENEIIKWDGVKRVIPQWNQNHTMKTAIKVSAVWFYQELARRIGEKRMQKYINLTNYGNRDIGGGIDKFWLQGDLGITPKEQIDFLVKLHNNNLPFSPRAIAIVKNIIIAEKTEDYVLRGKTGLQSQVGWYVGYIERDGNTYFFATQLDVIKEQDIKARLEITRSILKNMGLLPKTP
ncbi:class D beta-lactamase [Synechocystis sp. PCC 7509]|uniref:class D beta-lactamase n=1 Tax=Synechocystis sp. PCC 7509 TaxID=927677 RepID=UPI0002AC873B|nr:class D beta-lactamase [Synechocystis sp. PCC 7509]